jgi:hypothetical protein
MHHSEICNAIKSKNIIRFHYSLDKTPGSRIVEPHMVAYNEAGHLTLSAWYLSGASQSDKGPGWRAYLLSGISSISILSETFSGPREGYKSDGGKKFHDVQCSL